MPNRILQDRTGTHHCPGSPCLLIWTVRILRFITPGPRPSLHLSIYARNWGWHFLGYILWGRKVIFQRFILSVCCQFLPPCPVPGFTSWDEISIFISYLAFLGDTVTHSIGAALLVPCHRNGVDPHSCDHCALQSFKAGVPERY